MNSRPATEGEARPAKRPEPQQIGPQADRGRRFAAAASLLNRPLTSYYLILGCTALLLLIGLAMVLSTSSATQLDSGLSPYYVFEKQLVGAAIGLPMMWILSRMPPRLFRAVAYPLYLAAIASLVVVLGFGTSVLGAERWIRVGGILIQPSEFAKLAFLLWGADLLARREKLRQLGDWRALLIPLLPGAAILGLLVVLGHDIGTTFLLLVILLALLWVIGTPGRLFACILGLIIFALLVLVVTTKYANSRLTGYLNQGGNPVGPNMQGIQGKWALGSGGLFGVGIGDSKLKWGWVPEPSNDFIFAILGEELGLIGTVCVVLLYGGLAYAGLRVARRMTDPFMRLAAAGVTAWIVVQALVNICAVVGLLPITGVPLPLISAGLSSLLATMAAIGMLMSFARREPGAPEALASARPSLLVRAARSAGLGSRPAGQNRQRAAARAARAIRPAAPQRPNAARPGTGRPDSAQPDPGRPGAARPGTGRPGPGRPNAARPGTGRPGTGRPGVRRSAAVRSGTERWARSVPGGVPSVRGVVPSARGAVASVPGAARRPPPG